MVRTSSTLATLLLTCALFVTLALRAEGQNAGAAGSNVVPIVDAKCPVILRTLTRGASGDDVRDLQQFLVATGDYTYGEITGFYGAVTEKAVKSYQARLEIISTGTPGTTGWGAVGPRTRAAIAGSCANKKKATIEITISSTTAATTSKPKASLQIAVNQPPAIVDIAGADSVVVGEREEWEIRPADPAGAYSYRVEWGDASANILSKLLSYAEIDSFSSSPFVSHTYETTGTYTLTAHIRDAQGRTARMSITVRVVREPVSQTPTTPPTMNILPQCDSRQCGAPDAAKSCDVSSCGVLGMPRVSCSGGTCSDGAYLITSHADPNCMLWGRLCYECSRPSVGAPGKCSASSCATDSASLVCRGYFAPPVYTSILGKACHPERARVTVTIPAGTNWCVAGFCAVNNVSFTEELECLQWVWKVTGGEN